MNPNASQIVEKIQSEIDKISLEEVSSLQTISTEDFHRKIDDCIKQNLSDPNLAKRIRLEYLGWGPLEALLNDGEITEIIICGKDDIAIERGGILYRHADTFLSATTFSLFIRRLCHESGIELSYILPFLQGRWRDFRIQITSQPVTETPVVNLRRVRNSGWSLEQLKNFEMMNNQQLLDLKKSVVDKKNILVVGNTGSGKTSLVNALLGEIEKCERAVIIEDTNEILVPNSISSKMLTRFDPQNKLPQIDQALLVQQALRMRPDRIVVGEVRGSEAKDLILALSTGHGGGMGTLHAETANQALLRLEMLVSLGAPQWSTNTIRQMIRFGLDKIVVTRRHSNGRRLVEGIYQITSMEEFGLIIDQTS